MRSYLRPQTPVPQDVEVEEGTLRPRQRKAVDVGQGVGQLRDV